MPTDELTATLTPTEILAALSVGRRDLRAARHPSVYDRRLRRVTKLRAAWEALGDAERRLAVADLATPGGAL